MKYIDAIKTKVTNTYIDLLLQNYATTKLTLNQYMNDKNINHPVLNNIKSQMEKVKTQ